MNRDHSRRSGFTLIELMVVVAIMGVVLAAGIPSLYKMVHREALTAAIKDVVEVFSHARAKAILEGKTTQVIIRPQDGSFNIGVVGTGIVPSTADSVAADAAPLADAPPVHTQASGFSAQLSDRVHIELCDVNFNECKDFDLAYVRFYPNGTSDEFTLVIRSDNNEYRKISLEVVTALASVDLIK